MERKIEFEKLGFVELNSIECEQLNGGWGPYRAGNHWLESIVDRFTDGFADGWNAFKLE